MLELLPPRRLFSGGWGSGEWFRLHHAQPALLAMQDDKKQKKEKKDKKHSKAKKSKTEKKEKKHKNNKCDKGGKQKKGKGKNEDSQESEDHEAAAKKQLQDAIKEAKKALDFHMDAL